MEIFVVKDHEEMSRLAATAVIKYIKINQAGVLGLATGGTPERMYELLIANHNEQNVSWSQVITFNLDEYVGLQPSHEMSYFSYMHEKLFNHLDIDIEENVHIPSGTGSVSINSKNYEKLIEVSGGIGLQILGIGENGHIAFNEPGAKFNGRTAEVELSKSTIASNSRYFDSVTDVPKTAVSMGIATILEADKILLLASGKNKTDAIFKMLAGPITEDVPATALRLHKNVTIIVDEDAARRIPERHAYEIKNKNNSEIRSRIWDELKQTRELFGNDAISAKDLVSDETLEEKYGVPKTDKYIVVDDYVDEVKAPIESADKKPKTKKSTK